MAISITERPIFPPSLGDLRRSQITLEMEPTAAVLAIIQHEQLGIFAIIREDDTKPKQPRTFSAVRATVLLNQGEQNGTYRGSFYGLFRQLPTPPPPDPPPDPPPPPEFRRDIWHVFELQSNPLAEEV